MDKEIKSQNVWVDIRTKDTPREMKALQRKIWMSKTIDERLAMTLDMMDMVYLAARSSIQNNNPTISPLDLKIETSKRMYQHDYTPEKVEEIIVWMRDRYEKKQK